MSPIAQEVLSTLDNLQQRLVSGLQNRAGKARLQLEGLRSRRVFTRPFQRVHDELTRVDEFDVRLRRAIRQRAVASKQQLDLAAATLDALSPLKVLGRGYSITRRAETGELVTGSEQLVIGDRITTILASGQLTSCIETTEHI